MRKMKWTALLALLCLSLCGCQVSGEVENQAYVLILGVERLENSQIALTARVPKIGRSGDKQEGGQSGGSPYLTFSVAGDSWTQALEALQLATPRQTNLSHIEMLVVSEGLAREAAFPALLREIVETPHLYATARLVVCEGSAKAFIEAGETVIGTRLSAELRAMLSHYADQGYIPASSLADACFAVNSFYADPVAIWASNEPYDGEDGLATLQSPMKQRYCGTGLFRDGVLAGTLSFEETRLLNLIRGQLGSLFMECEGGHYELTPEGRPRLNVCFDGDAVALELTLRLSSPDGICRKATEKLESEIRGDVEALIRSCQLLSCDPFGFAEAAAGHFLTTREWLDYGWRQHYAAADAQVSVIIRSEVNA